MKRDQKITQREAIFYQLYKNRRQTPDHYIPVWQMIGEVYCEETKKWGFVSYEVSARCSEMTKTNPQLIERKKLVGRTGAKYYGYRFAPDAKPEMILDSDLHKFYQRIRSPHGKK